VSSPIVFGSFALPDTELTPRLLDRFHAGGGRALDVANVYRDGESATAVGRWLTSRDPEDVVVYAKGCHPPYCSPDLVAVEVERALGMLGLDRVDVFILHRDDPSLPVAAFAEPLLEQVRAQRIGGFGVSNWTVERLRSLADHLQQVGEADRLLAFSNHFSLAEMVAPPWPDCLALSKGELLGLADLDVTVLAWSSLARGFFAGNDDPSWDLPANRERRSRAGELAAQLGTSPTAVALAYVLHQPGYVLPVVGTLSETHLDEALAATELRLDPDQLDWLEAATAASPPG
jgi:aryl-alcohol dehydrogenase-like predicted oxidoreductase